MSKSDLVVKTNQLNSAVQNLSLPELRIIQLAIVDARETGKGLDTKKRLYALMPCAMLKPLIPHGKTPIS